MSFALHGVSVSKGIAIGKAVLISRAALEVSHYLVEPGTEELEANKLLQAFEQVSNELSALKTTLPKDAPQEMAAFLDVHHEFDNVSVLDDQILEMPQFDSVICHYPLDVWNGKDSGTIHFHGHTVFSHKTDLSKMNRVNVCTDFWNYTPVNYLTIKDFINE